MHDPDKRPRLRWRIFAWVGAGLIVLPVLYVMALGPLSWWEKFYGGKSASFDAYYNSLEPLRQNRQMDKWLNGYELWAIALPPSRLRQRAEFVSRIKQLEAELATMPARIAAAEREAQTVEKTYRAIEALEDRAMQAEVAALIAERPVPDQTDLRNEIERLVKSLPPTPSFMEVCSPTTSRDEQNKLRAELQEAKAMLQGFDAR